VPALVEATCEITDWVWVWRRSWSCELTEESDVSIDDFSGMMVG
jgi:hypothetical protein